MHRRATREDVPALVELAVAAGLFGPDESAFLRELFAASVVDGDGSRLLLDVTDGSVRGLAHYRPLEATDRCWDLTMIAVRPDAQGSGVGTALLREVEAELRADGQRMLVVETSGLPSYERTRAFYLRAGYAEQGTVADFWADGDDRVTFTRRL